LPPAAVTFDFWNTLVTEPPGLLRGLRRQAVLEALGPLAPEDPAELDARLAAAGRLHDLAWGALTAFRPRDAAGSFAARIPGLDGPRRDRVIDAYVDAGRDAELALVPGAAATVGALAGAGIPLGIVCDVGLTGSKHLRGFLARHGLLDAFSAWAFSDEVGTFKPSPVMFRHALTGLGVADASRAVHVGDLRRTDVAGARGCGMRAVRFRGVADDPTDGPEGDLLVDDLRELTADRLSRLVRGSGRAADAAAPPPAAALGGPPPVGAAPAGPAPAGAAPVGATPVGATPVGAGTPAGTRA
jgi:putative hydrolase of the HAD superfamily